MARPMNDYDWAYYHANRHKPEFKAIRRTASRKWYEKKKNDPEWQERRRANKREYWATKGRFRGVGKRTKARQELLDKKLELQQHLGSRCSGEGCNVTDHRLLDFDHIDPSSKVFSICQSIYRPIDELLEEIKKCQLLCANCHRLKTLANKDAIRRCD